MSSELLEALYTAHGCHDASEVSCRRKSVTRGFREALKVFSSSRPGRRRSLPSNRCSEDSTSIGTNCGEDVPALIPYGILSLRLREDLEWNYTRPDIFGPTTRQAIRPLNKNGLNRSFRNSITKILMTPADARFAIMILAKSSSLWLQSTNQIAPLESYQHRAWRSPTLMDIFHLLSSGLEALEKTDGGILELLSRHQILRLRN